MTIDEMAVIAMRVNTLLLLQARGDDEGVRRDYSALLDFMGGCVR